MNSTSRAVVGKLLVAVAMLIPAASLPAQTTAKDPSSASAPTPSADELIAKYVQANGGKDAIQKVTSRQSVGTISIPAMNMSGTIELHEKAPNKMLAVVVLAGAAFRQGFDGEKGWADDPQNGLRELAGSELDETRRQADFYHALDLHKLYSKLEVTGAEKVGDHNTYVVSASNGDGEPDKMYFDAQSGLPVRIVSQRHTPEGAMTVQEDLSDYREVDGVKIPFTVDQSTPQGAFTIKLTEVHDNVTFDDSQFAKPAAQ
jgi:hypothetical protein